MPAQLLGLSAGERLTPDGEKRYFRIVVEPEGLGHIANEFVYSARDLHNGLAGSQLVIPTHPPDILSGASAYVIDVVTHPQARAAIVTDLVEYVNRYNYQTRLRSLERIAQSRAGQTSDAARDRTRTETAVVQQQQDEGPLNTLRDAVTGGLQTVAVTVLVLLGFYLWLLYGSRR